MSRKGCIIWSREVGIVAEPPASCHAEGLSQRYRKPASSSVGVLAFLRLDIAVSSKVCLGAGSLQPPGHIYA